MDESGAFPALAAEEGDDLWILHAARLESGKGTAGGRSTVAALAKSAASGAGYGAAAASRRRDAEPVRRRAAESDWSRRQEASSTADLSCATSRWVRFI